MSFKLFELANKRFCSICRKWRDRQDFLDTSQTSCKDCLQHTHKGDEMKIRKGGFMSVDAMVILIGIVAITIGIGYPYLTNKANKSKESEKFKLLENRIRSLEITRNEVTKELDDEEVVNNTFDVALKEVENDVTKLQEGLLELVQKFEEQGKYNDKKILEMKRDIEASLRHIPTTIELAMKSFPTKIEFVRSPEKSVMQTEVKKTKTGYTKTIKKFSRPVNRKQRKHRKKKGKVRLADNLPLMNQ